MGVHTGELMATDIHQSAATVLNAYDNAAVATPNANDGPQAALFVH